MGLLVGDALGVPYEFQSPEALPSEAQLEFEPPAAFSRSHPGTQPGTWSDDGAQALCLLESLLHVGAFDPDDFGRRMVDWLECGHLAVGGHVFDVGIQTSRALHAIRRGGDSLLPPSSDPATNGNGALMRVLPLALWHRGADDELVRDARLSSRVTHGHLRSQLCCALYCLVARGLLAGANDPWSEASATLRALLAGEPEALSEFDVHVAPELAPVRAGSGYVVDTLRSSRLLLARGSYEQVVKAAVALGDDTDTTAAVVGGLAGVRDGSSAIPSRFREALRGLELYEPMLERLLAR